MKHNGGKTWRCPECGIKLIRNQPHTLEECLLYAEQQRMRARELRRLARWTKGQR